MRTGVTITILIAEDHHVVREGLRLTLEQDPILQVVGEASDGLTAMELVERHKPSVLLADLMLPRLHGLELTRRVTKEFLQTKVLILTMHEEEPYVIEALRNGASGYVLKDATSAELVDAIKHAVAGRRYLSPVLSERAFSGYVERPGESELEVYDTLTQRERMVLQLAAEGGSASQIAQELFISTRTVETHRSNLMRKLSFHSQTELVRFAIRKKIISS